MRRSLVFAFAVTLFSAVSAQAQVGMPGIQYSNTVAGGDGVQLYPYDQQDPWLHGYFQRYPAYGGFSSFRPYNYRHVFSQTQIAQGWGAAHGMPYSQQFWNKYRTSYLDQNLHSEVAPMPYSPSIESQPQPLIPRPGMSVYQASTVRPIGYESVANQVVNQAPARPAAQDPRPVHIFPNR
jgi:hypothetical protein